MNVEDEIWAIFGCSNFLFYKRGGLLENNLLSLFLLASSYLNSELFRHLWEWGRQS